MKARALWLLFAPVLACAAAVWVHAARELHGTSALPSQPELSSAAAGPVPSASAATQARAAVERASVSMRSQVADATESAIKVVDRASLEAYLAGLEARARKQGRVTALEIEPALAAIQQFDESGARMLAFTQKMRDLQRSFEAPKAVLEPSEQLDLLRDRIGAGASEAEKQRAVAEYLEVMHTLPPGTEESAHADLQRLTQPAEGAR